MNIRVWTKWGGTTNVSDCCWRQEGRLVLVQSDVWLINSNVWQAICAVVGVWVNIYFILLTICLSFLMLTEKTPLQMLLYISTYLKVCSVVVTMGLLHSIDQNEVAYCRHFFLFFFGFSRLQLCTFYSVKFTLRPQYNSQFVGMEN